MQKGQSNVDVESELEFCFVSSLKSITKAEWDRLIALQDYPFLRYEFILALEESGATNRQTGWEPYHLVAKKDGSLVAVMPCYIKSHSYGEYVFDHAWANAYHHNGLSYYPKLLTAIPFTPIPGPRVLAENDCVRAEVFRCLPVVLEQTCSGLNLSGWHLLFADQNTQDDCQKYFAPRRAVHFEWHNKGYKSFEEFLMGFSSRKRKNLKKERAYLKALGLEFEVIDGTELSEAHWDFFYQLYQLTYARKSGHGGYLSRAFFEAIATGMPESLVMVMALSDDEAIAAALCFKDQSRLYGRYWGCARDIKNLHFEVCYYQGIEYAIANGLESFDPGVQGEHKIQRGFEPRYTYSYHWLAHPEFDQAIKRFLQEEDEYIQQYHADACSYLPYKQE